MAAVLNILCFANPCLSFYTHRDPALTRPTFLIRLLKARPRESGVAAATTKQSLNNCNFSETSFEIVALHTMRYQDVSIRSRVIRSVFFLARRIDRNRILRIDSNPLVRIPVTCRPHRPVMGCRRHRHRSGEDGDRVAASRTAKGGTPQSKSAWPANRSACRR